MNTITISKMDKEVVTWFVYRGGRATGYGEYVLLETADVDLAVQAIELLHNQYRQDENRPKIVGVRV